MIASIVGIALLAALFAVFGLIRHKPDCASGACGACPATSCALKESDHDHA